MAANRLTFKATMVQVSVPASSANLGPGFDSFGLALDIRDRYAAAVLDEATIDVDVSGEGADDPTLKLDKNNLVVKAIFKGFEFMGQKPRGIAVRTLNATPHGKGLGSSASAIVGGLALSRALVLSGENFMSNDDLIALATEMEGHPDNVAAAVLGGATVAWSEVDPLHPGKSVGRAISLPVHESIHALLCIPQTVLPTSKARKLLPETVPHADAAMNAARAALFTQAISTRPELLFAATEDRLHQNYRREGMPKSLALVDALRAAGVAAVISGAGPTVLVLHTLAGTELEELKSSIGSEFHLQELAISHLGIQ